MASSRTVPKAVLRWIRAKALGLSITEATRFVYYPEPPPRDVTRNLQYRTSE